jgi:hypothetical protein
MTQSNQVQVKTPSDEALRLAALAMEQTRKRVVGYGDYKRSWTPQEKLHNIARAIDLSLQSARANAMRFREERDTLLARLDTLGISFETPTHSPGFDYHWGEWLIQIWNEDENLNPAQTIVEIKGPRRVDERKLAQFADDPDEHLGTWPKRHSKEAEEEAWALLDVVEALTWAFNRSISDEFVRFARSQDIYDWEECVEFLRELDHKVNAGGDGIKNPDLASLVSKQNQALREAKERLDI